MSTEKIMHAAVMSKSDMVVLGKCHADCFHLAKNIGLDMSSAARHQGFVTNKGRYVDRELAYEIALKAKQIKKLTGGILFSEDLWSKQSGGKYKYDSVKGYYL